MKAGAVEFLVKPFSDEALLDGIERAIERSKELLSRKAELTVLQRGKVMRKMYAQSLPDLVRMAEKLGIPAGRGDER